MKYCVVLRPKVNMEIDLHKNDTWDILLTC